MKMRLLPLFVAAALAAGSAQAADKTPAPTASSAQQQAARAEIDRLVKRIEELSKQLGDDGDVRVIVRKGGHRGPGAHPEAFEWEDGEGRKRIQIERLGPGDAPRAMDERGRHIEHIERMGPGGGKWKMEMPPGAFDFHSSGPGLGVVLAANTAASGVKIAAVTPDSPAMKAGIRSGDVLLQVNGKAIAGNGSAAVENARTMIGDLKEGQVVKLKYARQGKTYDASVTAAEIRRAMAFRREGGAPRAWGEGDREFVDHVLPPGVAREIQLIGPDGECTKGKKDCGLPMIYEAFRWQGLNLASLDSGLGRYFGAQDGVLVLSSSDDIKGLQSGDVIQKVGGSAVESPRDVMRALRDKKAGSQLRFDVLRDRKAMAVNVTVPEGRPLPFITPPPPPAPPAPPAPPTAARMTPPPAPIAPPPPPGAPRAAPPAPPVAPTPPPPPREGAVWTSDPGADAYIVTLDDEREDELEREIDLLPPVAR